MIKNKLKYTFALAVIAMTPFLSGCGTTTTKGYLVTLEIWGPTDDSLTYAEIINQYKKINPHVGEIKYRKFSEATYKQELLDALASGQGPDIFMINNAWFPSFENKIEPAPTPLASETDLKNNFPDVVAGDFMDGEKVYALPLSIDSMALYYNQDMFNAAGITTPPKTWKEFDDAVQKLTKVDSIGNILRSGAAIGTADNVSRAPDILSMMMIQNEVEMPTKKGMQVKFDEGTTTANGTTVQAGEQALGYYTKFAKLTDNNGTVNPFYSWNLRQHNSIDAFSEGTVGMMFNYSWRYQDIKNKNQKLNFGVAQIPQVNSMNPTTYANYWGYAVSVNKVIPTAPSVPGQTVSNVTNEMRTHEAWQFLRFLTLKNSGTITLYNAISKSSKSFAINFDPAKDYLTKTQKPAARRDLIEAQKTNPVLAVFATGNLIAKDWYQKDSSAVDVIISNMIGSVNRNESSYHEALLLARNKINSL